MTDRNGGLVHIQTEQFIGKKSVSKDKCIHEWGNVRYQEAACAQLSVRINTSLCLLKAHTRQSYSISER
jgi:hypothetical protein